MEKKSWMDLITSLDRRVIFVFVALAVIIPLLLGISGPVNISPSVQSVYDYIDTLKPGDSVMVVVDYDPASEAELYPMTLALFKHCLDRKLKVLSFTFWPNGASLVERALNQMKVDYKDIKDGVDIVNFGYQVDIPATIMMAGQDMAKAFPTDYRGNPTAVMPIMQGLNKITDIKYVIDLAAGQTLDMWVAYGAQRYHFTLGAGVTAVSATQYYPYLQAGQINGLIGGLKGAAEYEQLAKHPGRALAGMTAQSTVHALIIILVIISNVFYFITRKKGAR
jgi:hypothetical protein